MDSGVRIWMTRARPLSANDMGFRLNDVLLSAIARSKTDFYRKPREAFKDLANGIER
jgi:hypothetical protein